MKKRGRLYQDSQFTFDEFNGLKIEQLIICQNPETREPILVYIKVEGNNWHQFFLDVGIGFWDHWGEIDTDDDSYNFIDISNEYNLKDKIVDRIFCEEDVNNSKITIAFKDSGAFILKCKEPEVFDSGCELCIIP